MSIMGLIDRLPYAHAAGDGGPRPVTQVVVIHATDNTGSDTAEAGYATHRADKTSAHLYVDGDSAVHCLPLDNIAYGCLWHGNRISVQLELCGRSGYLSDATLRQAAPLVAEVCQRYAIPIRKITAAQVSTGVKGIVGHADITAAFPADRGTHTDPGARFPWGTFIGYVQAAGAPAPAIPPAPGDNMSQADIDAIKETLGIVGHSGVRTYQPGPVLDGIGTLLERTKTAPAGTGITDAQLAELADTLAARLPTAEQLVDALIARAASKP